MWVVWIIIAAVVLFILAVALYGSLEITKIPYLAVPYTPKDFGLVFEEVSFLSHDGLKLTGWFLPSPRQLGYEQSGQPRRPEGVGARTASEVTLIVLHGLGSNAGDMLLNTVCLAPRQVANGDQSGQPRRPEGLGARLGTWNLFYFNFRGHADSEGNRTSLGPFELRDLESALQFLKKAKPEAARRLAIYGHSLGAAVAIVGAAKHPELEAVAVESPFTRTRDTVSRFARVFYGIPKFPFMYLALFLTRLRLGVSLGDFAPIKYVGQIAPRPFFLIHAERDLRMPTEDIEAMMAAAGEPKELWVVPGADHGEPWMVAKEEYERRLVGFFERALSRHPGENRGPVP